MSRAPDPHGPLGAVVVASFARRFGEFEDAAAGARSDAPDAVHRARVALRRLRGLLAVHGVCFDPEPAERLRAELRWAARVLGDVRDAEVLREHVDAALDSLAAACEGAARADVDVVRARFDARLAERHREAFAALVSQLDGPRWGGLVSSCAAFVREPPLTAAAGGRAAGGVRRAVGEAEAAAAVRVDRARTAPASWRRWHEVRKAAKTVRCAAEVGAELPGEPHEAERIAWRDVGQALGRVQDATVVVHGVRDRRRELEDAARRAHADAGAAPDGARVDELDRAELAVLDRLRAWVRAAREQDLAEARDLLADLV